MNNNAFLRPWLIRSAIALLIGLVIDSFVLTQGNPVDNAITQFTSEVAGNIGAALSDQVVRNENLGEGYEVTGEGLNRVFVGHACNARNILLLYIGFLLTIPKGDKKRKLKFLLGGTLGIISFNIIRIVILFMIAAYMPAFFKFMHKYIFQISIYALLLWLWHMYIKPYLSEDESPNVEA